MRQLNITQTDDRGTLASLRALVPRRNLTASETLRIAELQANHLLRRFRVDTAAVPEQIVSDLPRVRVERERDLPVSGAAYWNGRYWVITISADDAHVRQRFSLMHEFKHVLDHTTRDYLYHDHSYETAAEQAERTADYFAACVLMSKRVVTRLWCGGNQNLPALAAKLEVSAPALRFRLHQLGLLEPGDRCGRPRRHDRRRPGAHSAYFRPSTVATANGGAQ